MAIRLPFRVPQLGPRMRRVARYVGLTFFAIVTFVFALQMTFPYKRVKDRIVDALADKYEVTIGSVDRGFIPGRVYFKAVTLRTRQTKPGENVTTFFIKQLELDAGILSLIGGTLAMDMEAQIGAGTLEGSIEVGKFGRGDINVEFTGTDLPADSLPMRAALGLPMSGKIQFSVDLNLPVEKSKLGKTAVNWQKVRGGITLACPTGCMFGDGKTKLKPLLKNTRNQVMVGEGIDFGKVSLDSLAAKATFKGGKFTVDKFDAKSKDGELKIDYVMTLEKEFSESQVAGCLRFKGSDDLLKREPKTYAAIQTTGAELRGDGLFHIRLTDRFKSMKRLNKECGPSTQINNAENFDGDNKPDRPELTIQPDQLAKPGSAAMPTAAPPPPTPTPTPTPADAQPTRDAGTAPTNTEGSRNGEGSNRGDGDGNSDRGDGDGDGDGAALTGSPSNTEAPREMQNQQGRREMPAEQGSAMPPPEE